jgi:hypothetical protein
MVYINEVDKNELVHFKGEISRAKIDSILQEIENAIKNIKWMKSILRVSYDLLISGYESGDNVEYILSISGGKYQVYCKHQKIQHDVAEFIDSTISKLKDYDENKLKDLIKRLTTRQSPITEKGAFFEDIIWSIYNIYRRKYAEIEVAYIHSDNEFVAMEFRVNFNFTA